MIYYAALTVYDLVEEEERTLLFCTESATTTKPTDTPANTEVDGGILHPAPIRREVVDKGKLTGPSEIAAGELVIINGDGRFDFLAHCSADNRACVIHTAADASVVYPDDCDLVFDGVMEQIVRNDAELTVLLKAVEYFALQPLQTEKYAGDNDLPDGLEGIASDLKGKEKIITLGRGLNVTPDMVNTSLLIEKWGDDLRDISAVYDSGGLLTPGDDYADETELQAEQPARGTYRKLKAGGYTRRGSGAVGQVTGDVWEGTTIYDRTTAQLFKRMAVDFGGLDVSRVSAADIAAFDAVQPALIGLVFKEPVTVGDALDLCIKGQGGVRFSDASGVLRLKRLEAPSGTPVATFTDGEIRAFDLARFGDNDAGLPIWKVTLLYAPLSTTQTGDQLIGSVASQRRARLAQPFLSVVAEDATVKDVYKGAREITIESRLMCRLAAQAEADRMLALLKVRRGRYLATIAAPIETLQLVDLYSVVAIQRDRYGMSNTLCRVLSAELEYEADGGPLLHCTLWGDA